MKFYTSLFLFLVSIACLAQDSLAVEVDNKYREDQFYASITYNALSNNPKGVSQNGFSTGFHFGFIRDMPINPKRNWALGIGLGISSNSYNQNLVIRENNNVVDFALQNDLELGNVTKNKFTTYLIDVPFELRWRTSNATDYKFWRIYPGFKFSYLVYNSTKLKSDATDERLSNLDIFNKFQYGLTLSAGYGTWNFQVYCALNPIFDGNASLNGNSIDAKALKVGIMFYIL
ncbi:outer membrane protein with beta-barrel domain [Winogradskyella wandonensis]|uniref:Outer membrane protein with beta-barrel domain n=1 Tax=Winogradskyella wandonensis TaxID=1442586 RepID=A0A4R1KJV3_9FLAO|nr:porin family protein [Winogradskyella wandonensis]TCK65066.1 outer membrane protein with beta-barrel domain [Winogradskyella wandonensis]